MFINNICKIYLVSILDDQIIIIVIVDFKLGLAHNFRVKLNYVK